MKYKVGDFASMRVGSDFYPQTIVYLEYYSDGRTDAFNGDPIVKSVGVIPARVTLGDDLVEPAPFEEIEKSILTGNYLKFTRRKNGRYVEQGQNMHGTGLILGSSHHYFDPGF